MLTLIHYLNGLPSIVIWILQLVICYFSILIMLRIFGPSGLMVFIGIVIIAANIQVLKIICFPVFHKPIALGTVLFTSAYLCSDILTEYYGASTARKGVYMGFAAMILMTTFMVLTMGFAPLSPAQASQASISEDYLVQSHLLALFTPAPALLAASLLSFLISQLTDIWIFKKIRQFTGMKWLWLRNNVSTLSAALLDNIIFNILAWRVFSARELEWETVIFSYIIGTYFLRATVSVLDTPFIYLAKYFLPEKDK